MAEPSRITSEVHTRREISVRGKNDLVCVRITNGSGEIRELLEHEGTRRFPCIYLNFRDADEGVLVAEAMEDAARLLREALVEYGKAAEEPR